MLVPLLLAGGTGTRLWPLSREARPKQFLPLANTGNTGNRSENISLMQATLRRIIALEEATEPLVIGNQEHRFLLAEELRQAGLGGRIVLEPMGRNTAAAAAAGALEAIARHGPDCQLLIMPSDHKIDSADAFTEVVNRARSADKRHKLVAFGIQPTHAETEYGYIHRGASYSETAFVIDEFVEKPDRKAAQAYVDSGEYYWNSGIFLFGAQAYLDALANHANDIYAQVRAAHQNASKDIDFLRLEATAFADCRARSEERRVGKEGRFRVELSTYKAKCARHRLAADRD